MGVILLFCFIFSVMFLVTLLKTLRKRRLPPGSLGLPFVGETLKIFSLSPGAFFAPRGQRYGEVFKTRILGCPCVVLGSPEAIRNVLATQAQLFKPIYPPSKEKLLGSWAFLFHHGVYHSHIRKLVQASFAHKVIRCSVSAIEAIANSALASLSDGLVINTYREMKKFTFDVSVFSIFGNLDNRYHEMLKKNYAILNEGYNSFAIKLPGSLYSKSLSARKRLGKILCEIIKERKDRNILAQRDLLSGLMNFRGEDGEILTDVQIADNIIAVLFAAQDTTASLLTWVLKYLHDDSEVLNAIKMEQKAIYEANEGGKRGLTWVQTRNMPLTNRVISESLRKSSIISFTYREAVVDVDYKGYLIPKGWKVLPLFRNLHHNPDFFSDPDAFTPSRFEVAPRPNTFMPFGYGSHMCPGSEVAKLEVLVLIHHLVNKFRWEVIEPNDEVEHDPFPIPWKGLPTKFWKQP